jgi:hypothetical protein
MGPSASNIDNGLIDLIKRVFDAIYNAKSISELENVPDKCFIPKKYQMNTGIYPKLEFNISKMEIEELFERGMLDEDFNLASDISTRMSDPLSKLLYALVWKRGDLKKLKHIVKGVLDGNNEIDPSEALVFHQFGKHLTGKKYEPIIDQHVLRAFGIYDALGFGNDCAVVEVIDRKHHLLIKSYKKWLSDLSSELKAIPEYAYHIDKILYAAGKAVKNYNSWASK